MSHKNETGTWKNPDVLLEGRHGWLAVRFFKFPVGIGIMFDLPYLVLEWPEKDDLRLCISFKLALGLIFAYGTIPLWCVNKAQEK